MAKVCQLFSGSSGNSILVSSSGHNYLVDIGVSAKRCENALKNIGIEPGSIEGIFVTHEHTDHAKGIRVFANRYNTPVYASKLCYDELYRQGLADDKTDLNIIENHIELDSINVLSFHQSHDSADCLGYRFNFSDGRSASICTDTGFITDNAKEIMPKSDIVFIESNHEIAMVNAGSYPYILKQRILGANGHLSNFACGEYIKVLAKSGTTRFVLSHLSQENNLPELARQTAISALSELKMEENKDYRLYVSPPENEARSIVL